jgi:chromate transporter
MDTPTGPPTFAAAARFWVQLGFVSFGGPAGQIAILHREVVQRRRWVDEGTFTGALNFCMLLPGPEALQLAIFLGWKLHGLRGGLVAGLGFLVPSVLLLFALSFLYASFGEAAWLASLMYGLQAAVIALVLQALWRIARRAVRTPLHVVLALGSFVALQFAGVPFPWVLLVAAVAGALSVRAPPPQARGKHDTAVPMRRHPSLRIAAIGLAMWLVPLLAVGLSFGFDALWTRLYLFFSKAALVTFGGAYAVLGYVTHELVERLGWITAQQSVAGLALAETTPGPLVIVLQFLGFMTGWNQPGALPVPVAALLGGALAAWATFLPSFVFIFIGAPHVDRLAQRPRIGAALTAITAAVVGVIATLALLLAQVVLFRAGWQAPDLVAVAMSLAAGWALERWQWPLPAVLGLAAGAGLLLGYL